MKKVSVGKDIKTGKSKLQIFTPINKRKIEEERILKKYPKIFRQRGLSMTETCMCWGLEVGLGWMKLIDYLCDHLQWDIDHNKYPQIEVTQVKEKFGGLRFYTNGANDVQRGMIDFAESLSYSVCEDCGTMEEVTQNENGWIRSLCPKCREDSKKKNNWEVK